MRGHHMYQPENYSKRIFFITATASFAGMVMAIPIAILIIGQNTNFPQTLGAEPQFQSTMAKSSQCVQHV